MALVSMRRAPCAAAAIVVMVAMLTSGCVFFTDDPTRFYTLATPAGASADAPHGPRVGLGPVTLPAYLRRPTIATRVDATTLDYATVDRWAEPLDGLFARTLGAYLRQALDAREIVFYPWYPDRALDFSVRVDVLAFETDASGTARLDASWSILEARSRAVRHSDHTIIVEPMGDAAGKPADAAVAAVAALSRAVAALAERIAAAAR
jgi:hypothetical protein